MGVSLPLPFGDRTAEYLDRVWGSFYLGFYPDCRQEQRERNSTLISAAQKFLE